MELSSDFLQETVARMARGRAVHGAILRVERGDGSLAWCGAAGNLDPDDRYFIASVTKLYITIVVMQLCREGALSLDAPMHQYLPEDLIRGLHVMDGVDRSREITVGQLLSNTSGITDYFFGKGPDGRDAAQGILNGQDEAWPLERIVERVRTLKPRFLPGQRGKVHYSDTNFELLGSIIEAVESEAVGQVLHRRIAQPLGLKDTYAFRDPEDTTPAPMYYRDKPVHAPLYLASITAEGGLVSTAREVMAVLQGFFQGRFFPVETIEGLKQWNRIYFPGQFDFGVGLERQWIPRIMSPFKPIGDLLGMWGQSGAFAFHNPRTDLYFTGTVNQLSGFGHGAAVRGMLRIIKQAG